MFIKTVLVSIGAILTLAHATSQLPLNDDNYMPRSSSEAQEMMLKGQQEVQTRFSPLDNNNPLLQVEAPKVGNHPGVRKLVRSSNDRVQEVKILKNINDEKLPYAMINIKFPVQAIRMLKQLEGDIRWGLFQELYPDGSIEKQLLAASKDRFRAE